MKNCDTCIYKGGLNPEITYDRNGYMVETRYIGIRCTNKDCIFFRSPTAPIVNAGLDNCKGYAGLDNCKGYAGLDNCNKLKNIALHKKIKELKDKIKELEDKMQDMSGELPYEQ